MTEHSIRAAIVRGGTSKGVFVHLDDLPPAGPARDDLVLALLGSPDPMQIDGLGGTHSSTSKLVAVGRSGAAECDIDYLFAQVSIDEALVDYQGNCGNLTTAVAPFAIDEGLVQTRGETAQVKLRNLNTNVRIDATVPLADGRAAVEGEHVVAGVPGTGAPITTDYLEPGGSVLGRALPTGNPIDRITTLDGEALDVSIVDVTSPHAFVRACDLGLDVNISPATANTDDALLEGLEHVRRAAGALAGLDSPAIPRLALVAPPDSTGADLDARAMSMQRMHHAFPMTGALCAAGAARIPGTIVAQSAVSPEGPVLLRHAKGVIEIDAVVRSGGDGPHVASVSVVRTARRLMTGQAHVVLEVS